jgi:hypothetical protein
VRHHVAHHQAQQARAPLPVRKPPAAPSARTVAPAVVSTHVVEPVAPALTPRHAKRTHKPRAAVTPPAAPAEHAPAPVPQAALSTVQPSAERSDDGERSPARTEESHGGSKHVIQAPDEQPAIAHSGHGNHGGNHADGDAEQAAAVTPVVADPGEGGRDESPSGHGKRSDEEHGE